MEQANVLLHRSEGDTGNSIPQRSPGPSQPLAPKPHLTSSCYSAGNPFSFTLIPDPSSLQPPQPIATTDGPPGPSGDLHEHNSTEAPHPTNFSGPFELVQEPANWISPFLPLSRQHLMTNATNQHLVIPTTVPRLQDHPVFQCKWEGCTSSTLFHREGDLMRHLKTIHISPDAFPCREPSCKRKFGRKDHLEEHRRRVHWR
ncbi:uncharacterized protein BJX67DRAFT_84895 [Aspergillus lucknowensis]|uniref:C2H2-type domain-containing protein n=1 Tax=Aspergillus lucknowensis TaxID=176173 RepID=A0ABR4LS57_9EURO